MLNERRKEPGDRGICPCISMWMEICKVLGYHMQVNIYHFHQLPELASHWREEKVTWVSLGWALHLSFFYWGIVATHGVTKSQTWLSGWTELNWTDSCFGLPSWCQYLSGMTQLTWADIVGFVWLWPLLIIYQNSIHPSKVPSTEPTLTAGPCQIY